MDGRQQYVRRDKRKLKEERRGFAKVPQPRALGRVRVDGWIARVGRMAGGRRRSGKKYNPEQSVDPMDHGHFSTNLGGFGLSIEVVCVCFLRFGTS